MGPDNFHLVFGTHGNCTKGYVLQTQWKGFRKSFVMTRANGERYMACPAFATLTFRSPNGRETVAYLRRKFFPALYWLMIGEKRHGIVALNGGQSRPLSAASRNRGTFTTASRKIERLIFETPSVRSANRIGTSTTLKPLRNVRYVPSI